MRTDNATLKKRVTDIEETLSERDLEALVVFANGSALGSHSKMHGYLRYLINFDGHNTTSVLVLRPGQDPALVSTSNPAAMRILRQELLWFGNVRTAKAPALGQEVVAILGAGERGVRRRVGYIGYNETPAPVWRDLENGLPDVEWIDFAAEIDKRRVQKDDLQLSFHRRAAEICDSIFKTVQRDVRKGLKGYQLQAAMSHTARFEGAEYCLPWLTISPKADYARFHKEELQRVPQEGDQVLAGTRVN